MAIIDKIILISIFGGMGLVFIICLFHAVRQMFEK